MSLAPPPSDPRKLRDFPQPDPAIGPGRPELFRIFRHRDPNTGLVRAPFNFASAHDAPANKGGRYDLTAPEGTCYLALSPVGAWLEVFRTSGIVAAHDVRRRRILETRPPRHVRAADLLAKRARGYGVTGEIHTTKEYSATRAWAAQLHRATFRALQGKIRHDPGLRERSLTLFDAAGQHEPYGWRWRKDIRRLDQEKALLAKLEKYGFRIRELPVEVATDELHSLLRFRGREL